MTQIHKNTIDGVYTLYIPQEPLPLVFDSPHSGTAYPPDFDYACDFDLLEKSEDKFVDELFSAAPLHGASLLCAHFPRAYIDANRCEKDIDLELLEDLWPEEALPTPRSHAGIGLIRRLVKPGIPLYNRPLKSAEVIARIETYYRPYHQALETLIEGFHYRYGAVWHVNCHSMPTPDHHGAKRVHFPSPDIVLGDRDGTSCDIHFTHAVRDYFKSCGLRVAVNDPYKGVELVRRYSSPATGRHSLQIEIARALYLNENTYEKSKGFEDIKSVMSDFAQFCADYVAHATAKSLAAD